jgi:ethanolamine utilization protein EutA
MTLQGASQAPTGGRVFFSGANRSLMQEDEIRLTSVGVDIGSSTAHLLFSEITLERLDTRYIVTERKEIHASRILLTPYCDDGTIDAEALGRFVEQH